MHASQSWQMLPQHSILSLHVSGVVGWPRKIHSERLYRPRPNYCSGCCSPDAPIGEDRHAKEVVGHSNLADDVAARQDVYCGSANHGNWQLTAPPLAMVVVAKAEETHHF
eukprot:scaffold60710_cov31-Tisochrysis_lutea.AAC.4